MCTVIQRIGKNQRQLCFSLSFITLHALYPLLTCVAGYAREMDDLLALLNLELGMKPRGSCAQMEFPASTVITIEHVRGN